MKRRTMMTGVGGVIALATARGAFALAADKPARRVVPASLRKAPEGPFFVPRGDFLTPDSAALGYVDEEWFASGKDDYGQSYTTQVYLRRPIDPAKFSGNVLVESLHASGVASIHQVASRYILREGHVFVCVASQKAPFDTFVKASSAERYAQLNVPSPPDAGPPPADPMARMMVGAGVSNAILAQVGAAIKSGAGPFARYKPRHVFLMGHSQTGMVTTRYMLDAHNTHRLAGGKPIYDGFFPAGAPITKFGGYDVPVIQMLSDGDISDGQASLGGMAGRAYRREDSDAPGDRFRLYEVAGIAHSTTRYPPLNSIEFWTKNNRPYPPGTVLNSLPLNEIFGWGLDQLVKWVDKDKVPPRSPRIDLAPDGRFFAKDAQGNSKGGLRLVQLDVPRATYLPRVPNTDDSPPPFTTSGTELPFDSAKMKQIYGSKDEYVRRFSARLDELIAQGWFLRADAEGMLQEARAQIF